VAEEFPPEDVPALATRATLVGRTDLHPDLARLVVAAIPAALPPAWVGDPHAFPSLVDTQLPVNEDARKFLVEGPTPLEGFLPFEVASPLSRIYLVLLPLLVIAFPLFTLTRASWAWFLRSRIVGWYPRIHAIERGIDSADLDELLRQREFLGSLSEQVSHKTKVPASYLAAYYDLRADIEYVTHRLDARIATLQAAGTTAAQGAGAVPPATTTASSPASDEEPEALPD
jgi:hypothetical protein